MLLYFHSDEIPAVVSQYGCRTDIYHIPTPVYRALSGLPIFPVFLVLTFICHSFNWSYTFVQWKASTSLFDITNAEESGKTSACLSFQIKVIK